MKTQSLFEPKKTEEKWQSISPVLPPEYTTPTGRLSKHYLRPPKFTVLKDGRSTEGNYICRFYLGGKNYSLSTFKAERRAAEKAAEAMVMRKWEEWKAVTSAPLIQLQPESNPKPLTPTIIPIPEPEAASLPLMDSIEASPTRPSKMIAEAATEWLSEYGKQRPRSLRTIESIMHVWMKRFRHTLLDDITAESLAQFQKSIIPTLSKRSADGMLTYVKKFCRWCTGRGYMSTNPAEAIKPKMEGEYGGIERNKDVWPEEFFNEFVAHFIPSERKALQVYWHTGIDLCDISRLEIRHIKVYADGVQYIELGRLKAKDKSANSKEIIRFPLNKGTPIHKLVMDAINLAKKKDRTALFNRYARSPNEFTSHLTNKRIAVFKSKYPDKEVLTWKSLRATFFTRCRNAGIPDSALIRWGGWVDATQLSRVYDRGVTTAQHTHMLEKPFKTSLQGNR